MNMGPNNEFDFRLAVFLKETDIPSISKMERFRKSEQLLLKLQDRYPTSGQLDVTLADLYYKSEKYVSALGHALRAKLNGYPVDSEVIDTYHKRLLKKESIDLSEDSHGAYLVGSCLIAYGSEKGLYFLEKSLEFGKGPWLGFAAMELAEAYRENNVELHLKFLKMASDLGHCDIIRRHNSLTKPRR